MPAYGTRNPQAIYPGDLPTVLWSAEAPATGTTSLAVALFLDPNIGNAAKLSVEVSFSAAPGAFEIDIQDADTDVDAAYIAIPNAIINAVNAGNFARFELSPFVGRFVRLLMKTQPANAVNTTAKVTR